MPNHLADETSPYLRQHQDNPVDWYPWGEEALVRAQDENKPIFLSIGYAACHWCHVMAHESFEDPHIAKFLNEHFISIKVDREERPDLDDIYMQAVVMLTGQGGWPMSVFLTPELKPFFGGTYFPPLPSHGLPSFGSVLTRVIDTWKSNPQGIENNAQVITKSIQAQLTSISEEENEINLEAIVHLIDQNYDWQAGGWGQAPKFPQAMLIQFLIQQSINGNQRALAMVNHALDHMSRGGLYDLVGGGFHRYSTDRDWLVPHFEKMLYDNALLALTYLHAFAVTGNPVFRQVTTDTLDFIQSEMTLPQGGFCASLDADTIAGEGRFYTWQISTLKEKLSKEDFDLLQAVMDLSPTGNFEKGLYILRYKQPLAVLAQQLDQSLDELIAKLKRIFTQIREIRSKRPTPAKDDKVITAWNALAIQAFAEAGLLLARKDYLTSAQKALDFLLQHLQTRNGQILRSWSQGKANIPGTLADYAGLILALHAVYQINFSPKIYTNIHTFYEMMEVEFGSDQALYYDNAANITNLLFQSRNPQDNATPSGNALAAHVHWLMAQYEHDPQNQNRLSGMINAISPQAARYPTSFGYWLGVADLNSHGANQVAIISEGKQDTLVTFLDVYRSTYRPYSIIASISTSQQQTIQKPKLLSDRGTINNQPTAYVCRDFYCQRPTKDPNEFRRQLEDQQSPTNLADKQPD